MDFVQLEGYIFGETIRFLHEDAPRGNALSKLSKVNIPKNVES